MHRKTRERAWNWSTIGVLRSSAPCEIKSYMIPGAYIHLRVRVRGRLIETAVHRSTCAQEKNTREGTAVPRPSDKEPIFVLILG